MTDSISQSENPINEQIKTAIFYSVSDLGNYLVEIRHQSESYFIQDQGQSKQLGNMDTAKQAALKEGAEQGYQALSRTYQEVEATAVHLSANEDEQKFDYIKVNIIEDNTKISNTTTETETVFS